MIAFLILKEVLQISYDDLRENGYSDLKTRLALHLFDYVPKDGSYPGPPSKTAVRNFLERVVNYNRIHHTDLLLQTLQEIGKRQAFLMGVDWFSLRIDTSMVETPAKRLSRMEIIYSCIARFLKARKKAGFSFPNWMAHYLDRSDHNAVFYHNWLNLSLEDRKNQILQDAWYLVTEYSTCLPIGENKDYMNLVRAFHEQTIFDNGILRFRKDKSEGLNSETLQNPTDPDAGCREKNGIHIGHEVGVVVAGTGPNSLIVALDFNQNTVSDGQFMDNLTKQLPYYPEDHPAVEVGDGGFCGEEHIKRAAEKNIQVITTNLTGKKPKSILLNFDINQKTGDINCCPNKIVPLRTAFSEKSGSYSASFPVEVCKNCPFKNLCHPIIQKTRSRKTFKVKELERARKADELQGKEFAAHCRCRNGVETEFNRFNNQMEMKHLPVYGKERIGIRVKLMALGRNARSFLRSPTAMLPGLAELKLSFMEIK